MSNEKSGVTEMAEVQRIDHVSQDNGEVKTQLADKINQDHADFFLEAIQIYPTEESIDREAEKRLKRKLDWRIIPLLGVCYFFYVSAGALLDCSTADILDSTLTKRLSRMRPSLASKETLICTDLTTRYYPAAFTSVG